jgi:hypothetical protein
MLDTSEITEIGQMEDEKRQQPGDTAASGSKESIGNKAGLRFRQNTTISGSSQSSSSERKFGPRFPDKPLLPAHNPPPFSIIDDVLPFLRIGRSLFKFGRKQAELLLDEKAAEARMMKKKYKKVYSGSNIPLECVLHISNCKLLLSGASPCAAARLKSEKTIQGLAHFRDGNLDGSAHSTSTTHALLQQNHRCYHRRKAT